MDKIISEYSDILAQEENLLDRLAERQLVLRKSIV